MERFRIPCKIPKAPPSTTKSIRFPNGLVEQVEQAIQRTDCTFSAFVLEAVRFALEHSEQEETPPYHG